jgi:hypothetical protein
VTKTSEGLTFAFGGAGFGLQAFLTTFSNEDICDWPPFLQLVQVSLWRVRTTSTCNRHRHWLQCLTAVHAFLSWIIFLRMCPRPASARDITSSPSGLKSHRSDIKSRGNVKYKVKYIAAMIAVRALGALHSLCQTRMRPVLGTRFRGVGGLRHTVSFYWRMGPTKT